MNSLDQLYSFSFDLKVAITICGGGEWPTGCTVIVAVTAVGSPLVVGLTGGCCVSDVNILCVKCLCVDETAV